MKVYLEAQASIEENSLFSLQMAAIMDMKVRPENPHIFLPFFLIRSRKTTQGSFSNSAKVTNNTQDLEKLAHKNSTPKIL